MPPGVGFWPVPGLYEVVISLYTLSLGCLILLKTAGLWPSVPSFGGLVGESPDPSVSIDNKEGYNFSGFVQIDDTVSSKSVMDIKPHSDMVIGYQVGTFTCAWSAKNVLLAHKFTLYSQVRCLHKHIS